MKVLVATLGLILFTLVVFGQECETIFNFNDWTMEGTPDANWEVVDSANVVNASYVFPTTFFVNNQNLINVQIKGTMSVESSTDNDFTGIVLGYKKPTELADDNQYRFFLFDWKAEGESFSGYRAEEGFRLSRYDGTISLADQGKYFWGAAHNPPLRYLIEEKYGSSLGWVHHQTYQFELLYTTNRLRITIDDNVIFEHEGCFEAGRFGFYCFSQDLTRFEDFSYKSFIDFVSEPQSVCSGETIHFNAFDLNCSAFPDFIESMHWDFGDGETSTEINPDHTYVSEGEYAVKLIVLKTGNCSDTIVKNVSIKSIPVVSLGADTLVPGCSSIAFDAANPGASYLWSTGEISQTIELSVQAADTSVWVSVKKNGCSSGDTVLLKVEELTQGELYFPNAFTPNGDGSNDEFKAIGPTDNISDYNLQIYNRWGQLIFTSDDPDLAWDGGQTKQAGVYVFKVNYTIEGECIQTKYCSQSGWVILLS